MAKILIVEDEKNLRIAIANSLQKEGYHVIEAFNGQNGLDVLYQEHIDLIITDVMMPQMDGNEFVKEVRDINKDIPIIMLTALESINDKEVGFDNGVDDYLVKPVQLKEISMRVKTLLRRYKIINSRKIEFGNTIIDYDAQSLKIKNRDIKLSKKEFQLLFKLVSHPEVVFSREKLLNEIWDYTTILSDRAVDTHLSRLREKVQGADFEIITVWGTGYKVVFQ